MHHDEISLPVKNQIGQQANMEASPCVRTDGSYMVETAVLLPFFAGFMAVLLFFLQALTVQQEVGTAMLKAGRELSVLASGDVTAAELTYTAQALIFKNLKKDSVAESFIRRGRRGIVLEKSDFSGNYIYIQADYQMRVPFALFGRQGIHVTQKIKCRKWTGQNGDGSEDGEIVYITPNGTVYHKKRSCSYLSPSVSGVGKSTVSKLRNDSGGKYYPCELCMKKHGDGGSLVYITKYGERYHSQKDCSRLKRTVSAVRLQNIRHRNACSKCGKE